MNAIRKLLKTDASAAIIFIRISVGMIFLSEGVQKFLYPATRGAGRFERMGFEAAEILAPMVGGFEVVCGTLILLGLLTRFAAVPLIGVMLTALTTTKLPILLGQDLWGFHVRELSAYGFWSMAHEMRTDFAMLLGALFLLVVGGGKFSMDALLFREKAPSTDENKALS